MKNTFPLGIIKGYDMENKKAFIFDLDGTLVDSMPVWAKAMLNILDSQNISYPDDFILTIATMGGKACAEYFRSHFGITYTVEEMFKLNAEYCLPRYRDEIVLKDGVKTFLEKIKKEGHSLNVLTASPHVNLDPCLKRNGVYELFDNLWSTDDFNLTKTDVRIYDKVIELLGVNPHDAYFFDDNINALTTAKNAGLNTIGVFDKSSENLTEQIKAIADKYIYSFNELL